MHTIILNLNHYNWFISKIGYIDFVPLSGKLSLEIEFKDMKQTQHVNKTSLTLNPFNIRFKQTRFYEKRLGKDYLSPIFATSPSLHNRLFENVLNIHRDEMWY